LGYHTAARDEDACSPGEMWRNPRKNSLVADKTGNWRRDGKSAKSSLKDPKDRLEDLTGKADNPYKKKTPTSREEGIQKEVLGLLNKICPENKDRIIKKLGEIQVDNSEELEIVIQIIFRKVTDDPHHCETYVDMVSNMSQIYSEKQFPQEEGQVLDFRRMLVNQCQNKFEDLLQSTDQILEKPADMEQEEYDDVVRRNKTSALATMKFIGFLYLRKLIAAAVIRQVVKELLNGTSENPDSPPELQVEYALELIQATGHEFDKSEKDKVQLNFFFGRLNDLKKFKRPDNKPCLSRRLQFQIQDLVDMRNQGWAKSKHKEVARTMAEVAEDQKREEREAEQAASKASKAGKGRGRNYG
jgi:translation initiation factor 4G